MFTQTVVFLDSLVCPMLMMFLICDTEAFFLSLLSISLMSPIITLTKAYSMRLKKTKRVQEDINMSMAFIYETGGSDFWLLACWVERVRREVTPRVTLAGTASGLIQKEIQDIITIKQVGMYVWNMKNPNIRLNLKTTIKQVKFPVEYVAVQSSVVFLISSN